MLLQSNLNGQKTMALSNIYQYYNLHFHINTLYDITTNVPLMNVTTMIHKMVIHMFEL